MNDSEKKERQPGGVEREEEGVWWGWEACVIWDATLESLAWKSRGTGASLLTHNPTRPAGTGRGENLA